MTQQNTPSTVDELQISPKDIKMINKELQQKIKQQSLIINDVKYQNNLLNEKIKQQSIVINDQLLKIKKLKADYMSLNEINTIHLNEINNLNKHLLKQQKQNSSSSSSRSVTSTNCSDSNESDPQSMICDEDDIQNDILKLNIDNKINLSKAAIRSEELLVTGYIRTEIISSTIFPYSIIQLVCLWHNEDDWWDPKHIHNELLSSLEYIEREYKYKDPFNTFYNVFGSMIISAGYTKIWKLKITKGSGDDGIDIIIGIIEHKKINNFKDILSEKFTIVKYGGYGCYGYNGVCYHNNILKKEYCKPWKKWDTITMILDLSKKSNKKGTLSYLVNDNDYGVSFDVDMNLSYSLAVSIGGPHEIKLMQ